MLFDTHAHMNDRAFQEDRHTLMASFPQKGISALMNVGWSLETSRECVELAKQYDYAYASVGSHPDTAEEVNEELIEEYRKLCKLERKIKAIGEIGLDYHYEPYSAEVQKKAFSLQLELARELDMPVIVHERDAHQDGMDMIRQFPQVTGVFHCYSGSPEMARQLVDMGWYIGFTGVLTFKNAKKAVQTAQSIPLERIVIETDCPYMAPEPFRGNRSDPSMVVKVAEKLGEIRGISTEEACRITLENGKRLYRIVE